MVTENMRFLKRLSSIVDIQFSDERDSRNVQMQRPLFMIACLMLLAFSGETAWGLLRARWLYGEAGGMYVSEVFGIRFSLWWVVFALALPAIAWFFDQLMLRPRRQRKEWALAGRCRACGYDLTGNTSGICPECGAIVPKHE